MRVNPTVASIQRCVADRKDKPTSELQRLAITLHIWETNKIITASMRAVHESAYKPKPINETKFVVNIRPSINSAAAKSVARNGGGEVAQVNKTDAGLQTVVATAPAHNSKTEVNWRRIFTVSSLIVSILLISGSIYLHLKQKPHFGRLHHEQHMPTAGGVDGATLMTTTTPPAMPFIEHYFQAYRPAD